MIQVKEFVDSEHSLAVDEANAFLAGLNEESIVEIRYSSNIKKSPNGTENQRSAILVVYRKQAK